MDENAESGAESGWEYQLLLSAAAEEEQDFQAYSAEIDAKVGDQLANLLKDLK